MQKNYIKHVNTTVTKYWK